MIPQRYILVVCLCTIPTSLVWAEAFERDRLSALFFGEVGMRERESQGDDGVHIGQAVGQLTYSFNDKLSVFTETTLTSRHGQSINFEFERLSIRYDFSDQYKLSLGRYHTPVGYWNAAYHHGSWLQTTVGRPNTMRFGSHIVPIHFQGALLEGTIANSSFSYRVGVGSGRGEDLHEPTEESEAFDDPAVLLGGSYRSHGDRRFEVGVTAYLDEPDNSNGVPVDETLLNIYFALLDESPEFIAEYTFADHDARTGSGEVHSVYAQVAHRLDDGNSPLKPYLRAEEVDVDRSNPLLGSSNLDYSGMIAGLRWDFSPFAALKTELRREKFGSGERSNGIWLQLSFVQRVTR